MSERKWREVTRDQPCPACGKPTRCGWGGRHGNLLSCFRSDTPPPGMRLLKRSGGAMIFGPIALGGNDGNGQSSSTGLTRSEFRVRAIDWRAEHERCRVGLTVERLEGLAAALGVRADALAALQPGWASTADLRQWRAGFAGGGSPPAGAFAFAERDGRGTVIGLSLRAEDGRKGFPAGARRGLIIPSTLADAPDPVLVVEGASDVAALVTLGLAVVGRPSNSAGAAELADLLESRDVLVLGENDQKGSGHWPGRDGARGIAARLAETRGPTKWALPPDCAKDLRAWLQAHGSTSKLNVNDPAACAAVGKGLLKQLQASAREENTEKISQAERICRLAQELFRLGVDRSGEPFAVRLNGPNTALMFRGSSDALRSALAREYRWRTRKTPSNSALADAITALAGEAQDLQPEIVALRVAAHNGGIVIDRGDPVGSAIVVTRAGWQLRETSPVLFRRTALTAELPEPVRGGDANELRRLLNVTDDTWTLILGWLLAAFMPEIPHPVLMIGGEQGTAKTTCAKLLLAMFDPSNAPIRSVPRDLEQWAIAAAGSWGVVIDNLSVIPAWLSDSLCKAVTGDGWVTRKLYSNSDLTVLSFRRVTMLTTIDPGALRGDVADRLLLIELDPIPEAARRTEAEIQDQFARVCPRALGGLLDLLASVLAELPNIKLQRLPRMADFARLLAAMDKVIGTRACDLYLEQRQTIASDVVEGNPVATAVVALLAKEKNWSGTATELLERIAPEKPGREWPKSGRGMGARLKDITPALRAIGIRVKKQKRGERIIDLEKVSFEQSQQPLPPSINPGDGQNLDLLGTMPVREPTQPSSDRPSHEHIAEPAMQCADDWDERDDCPVTSSVETSRRRESVPAATVADQRSCDTPRSIRDEGTLDSSEYVSEEEGEI